MHVPKALFDKAKLPTIATPEKKPEKVVGKFTVTESSGKEVITSDLQPKPKVPGTFVPPKGTVAVKAELKKPNSPAPLFASKHRTEADLTAADILLFKGFSNREIIKIRDQAENIDLTDRVAVIQYGQDLNKKLAKTVDDILDFVKVNAFDSKVSPDVSRLQSLINFNPTESEASVGLFGMFKKKKTLEERINDVINGVDDISISVDKNVTYFLTLMPKLDEMLDECKSFHTELLILIAAGKERVSQFKRRKLQRLQDQLTSNNMMLAQNARDEMNIVDSFVKRIETLELTVGQNELTLAQIRITQATNVKMVESLNNMMSNMIPMWKHSLISAITTNNFDNVNKNKDLLSQNLCDIMSVKSANAST